MENDNLNTAGTGRPSIVVDVQAYPLNVLKVDRLPEPFHPSLPPSDDFTTSMPKEELDKAFEALLEYSPNLQSASLQKKLKLKGAQRETLSKLPIGRKRLLLHQNEQLIGGQKSSQSSSQQQHFQDLQCHLPPGSDASVSIADTINSVTEPSIAELLAQQSEPDDEITQAKLNTQRSRHPTVRGASHVVSMALQMNAKALSPAPASSSSLSTARAKLKGQVFGSNGMQFIGQEIHDSRKANGVGNEGISGFWSWFAHASTTSQNPKTEDPQTKNPAQGYVEEITTESTSVEAFVKHLTSLRLVLSTAKISWIKEFLDECNGLAALEAVLEKFLVQGKRNNYNAGIPDVNENVALECVRCLRALLNTDVGFARVVNRSTLVYSVSDCLFTSDATKINSGSALNIVKNNCLTRFKVRTISSEILSTLCLQYPQGHKLVVETLRRDNPTERFRQLVDSLSAKVGEQDTEAREIVELTEWEYKVAVMRLLTAVVNTPKHVTERCKLREELSKSGLEGQMKPTNSTMLITQLLVNCGNTIQLLREMSPFEFLVDQMNIYEKERRADLEMVRERLAKLEKNSPKM
ncbi:armadillo-type protein [Jimgerdemannia flammicorona]|uniref:Armadillo-type protein n=1 Tax=Jimgerdemannia flammicorona TaxID=994334 RepID=A0A433D1T3_9FUNG|nr:armadillo-type protein [Jimgerdemannia flammicorona]